MLPFLVLLFAAVSRLLPHTVHAVGLNITAVGGGLLFFGSRRPRWQAGIAAGLMALTDVYLTRYAYGYPFHVSSYIVTWCWYAAVCLLGSSLLCRVTVLRVCAAIFCSATGFFLLSNFVVWMGGGLYAHSTPGLAACYAAGLPFYANDLVSTGLTAGVLFGLPVVASRLIKAMHMGTGHRQPLN